MIDQARCHCVSIRNRIGSEEFDYCGHVIDAGGAVSLLPIDDAHLIAANYFCHVDLPKAKIESALAHPLADGLRIGRIALLLSKVMSDGATNPT